MNYRIPGFTLDLPKGAKDHSIFIFTLTPDDEQAFSITVIRCSLPAGSELSNYVTEDIAMRETSGEGYALSWKKSYLHEGVSGIITAGTLKDIDDCKEERRLYLFVGNIVLVMTALVHGIFTLEQLDALNEFIKGFHPDITDQET